MDNHTFTGKRKVGSTEICYFTDYQGIGRDPLYKRYESVYSIIKKHINPQFTHFLAAPDYSVNDDAVNWYIDEWNETPETLSSLQGERHTKYQSIKDETIAHYREVVNNLSVRSYKSWLVHCDISMMISYSVVMIKFLLLHGV